VGPIQSMGPNINRFLINVGQATQARPTQSNTQGAQNIRPRRQIPSFPSNMSMSSVNSDDVISPFTSSGEDFLEETTNSSEPSNSPSRRSRGVPRPPRVSAPRPQLPGEIDRLTFRGIMNSHRIRRVVGRSATYRSLPRNERRLVDLDIIENPIEDPRSSSDADDENDNRLVRLRFNL